MTASLLLLAIFTCAEFEQRPPSAVGSNTRKAAILLPAEPIEEVPTVPYLPENYVPPQPITAFQGFLQPEPIKLYPKLHWPWGGNQFTPALTIYGSYSVFGTGINEGDRTLAGIGHQMLVDVDFDLGATERIHAQWRPVGEKNTGGSFLQLNNDVTYFDNASALPQRIWLEASIAEVFCGFVPDRVAADWLITAGLFPYQLHNRLLINDDIVGVSITKNTIIHEPFSNLLIQVFGAVDEIDAYENEQDIRLAGLHLTADVHNRFFEMTYAHLWDASGRHGDEAFLAASVTQLMGPMNVTGRVLANIDASNNGSGQLYVIEGNWAKYWSLFPSEPVVFYATAFWATNGWNPISGGNYDRLRSTFEVNPLVRLSADNNGQETRGVTLGAELFGKDQRWALIPEVACEFPESNHRTGFGLRWRRQMFKRSQVELRALTCISDDESLVRHGLFAEWLVFF